MKKLTVYNTQEVDRDILVMPKPHARRKSAHNLKEKIFILTSEEAYAAKVLQKEEKEKKIRQQKRKKLKSEKGNPPAAVNPFTANPVMALHFAILV